ncbi:MAG: riboflavin synthase [Acidimicrobiales bacterium]
MAKKKEPKGAAGNRTAVIGVIDTMFARYDMGAAARAELADCPGYSTRFIVRHQTVPGFKDLAVAAKRMIEREGADVVVVLGMPGSAPIDKQCAHEASLGIMWAQLMTSTPILEVFVHEDEADDPVVLASVFENRSRRHARNAYWMLFEPEQLTRRAGLGVRQGFADAGPLDYSGHLDEPEPDAVPEEITSEDAARGPAPAPAPKPRRRPTPSGTGPEGG